MEVPCQNYIQTVFEEDVCHGETKPAQCVIDASAYIELGVEANSSQHKFNQAIYLAFLNMKATIENLQSQIDNL